MPGPLVSIVMPCRNVVGVTRRCVDSVLRHSSVPYELIAVDNASRDGTRAFLSGVPGARVIANGVNRGFPGAVNQGVRAARGRYVLLLNNDVIVSPGYLEELLAVFHRVPRAGVAAPTANPAPASVPARSRRSGRGRWAPFWAGHYRDLAGFLRFASAYSRAHAGELSYPTPHELSCFCHLFPREVLRRVGEIDEGFAAYYEDTDYFHRAVQKGFKLVRAGGAYVHHFWFATYVGNRRKPVRLAERSRRRFIEKWGLDGWLEAKGYLLGRARRRAGKIVLYRKRAAGV